MAARTSADAAFWFALSLKPRYEGTAIASRMPMIATTTRSSISVKPSSRARRSLMRDMQISFGWLTRTDSVSLGGPRRRTPIRVIRGARLPLAGSTPFLERVILRSPARPDASRVSMALASPTGGIDVRQVLREGKLVAVLMAIDHGATCTVVTETFGQDSSKAIQRRPFTFPNADAAQAFIAETLTAFTYLGCEVRQGS